MQTKDVTDASEGTGFTIYGCPVHIDIDVWDRCVKWSDSDNDNQTYQEEDARLWDILFVGGSIMQMEPNRILKKGIVKFHILCVLNDGVSTNAVQVKFKIQEAKLDNTIGLLVSFDIT